MGFSIKFNWVLQVDVQEDLHLNNIYTFSKSGNRVFPIGTPIDLIDMNRNALAKIQIINFTNSEDKTKGNYKVLKIYSDKEKKVLNNYWIENQIEHYF